MITPFWHNIIIIVIKFVKVIVISERDSLGVLNKNCDIYIYIHIYTTYHSRASLDSERLSGNKVST